MAPEKFFCVRQINNLARRTKYTVDKQVKLKRKLARKSKSLRQGNY